MPVVVEIKNLVHSEPIVKDLEFSISIPLVFEKIREYLEYLVPEGHVVIFCEVVYKLDNTICDT